MADLDKLYQALDAADKAGNQDDVRDLTAMIKETQAATPAEKPAENEARRAGIKPVKSLRERFSDEWSKQTQGEKGLVQTLVGGGAKAAGDIYQGLKAAGQWATGTPTAQAAENFAAGREKVGAAVDKAIPSNDAAQNMQQSIGKPIEMGRELAGRGMEAMGGMVEKSPLAKTALSSLGPVGRTMAAVANPERGRVAGEAGFDVASQVLPMAAGAGVKAPVTLEWNAKLPASTPAPKLGHTQDSMLKLKQDGYVVPPNVTNPSLTQKTAAAVADPDALLRKVRQENAANDTRLAAKDLGLPEDARLDETTLQSVRDRNTPAYDAIRRIKDVDLQPNKQLKAELGDVDGLSKELGAVFPDLKANKPLERLRSTILNPAAKVTPGAMLDLISELRTTAKELKGLATSLEERRAAGSVRNMATVMEDFLERKLTEEYWVGGEPTKMGATTGRELAKVGEAGAATPISELSRVDNKGRQKLIDNWRAARQQLAKLNDVEDVVNTQTSRIDSAALSRLKKEGHPLSGGLKRIAEAYDAMEGLSSSGIHASDVTRGRAVLQALKGAGAGAGLGFATGGPVGAGLGMAAGLALPAATRELMVSKLYQQYMTNPSPSILAKIKQLDPKAAAAVSAAQAGRTNDKLPEAQK